MARRRAKFRGSETLCCGIFRRGKDEVIVTFVGVGRAVCECA